MKNYVITKITPRQMAESFERRASGESLGSIAKRFQISSKTLSEYFKRAEQRGFAAWV